MPAPVPGRHRTAGPARTVGRPRTAAALGLVGALASLAACALAGPPPGATLDRAGTAADAATDSLRGTVVVVGAEPLTRVVLQTRDGDQRVLAGESLPALRRLDGLEIRCDGRLDAGELWVTSFRVLAAHGVPARDGILEIDEATAVLVTEDGRRTSYTPVPTGLRDWVGRRVWIAGTPGSAPESWGVISPGA